MRRCAIPKPLVTKKKANDGMKTTTALFGNARRNKVRTIAWLSACFLGGFLIPLCSGVRPLQAADDAPLFVDFRYSPQWWVTSICLPDDPYKTLVGRDGELLYHYAGRFWGFGVNVGFQTTLGVTVSEDAHWVRQELESPRVPIVKTYRESPTLRICEEVFAVVEALSQETPGVTGRVRFDELAAEPATPMVRRTDPGEVLSEWAKPPAGMSGGLACAAVGAPSKPICYAVSVPRGALRKIALAICEGGIDRPGRVLELNVEGAKVKTVDAAAEAGKNQPIVSWFDAQDVDKNGEIKIQISSAAKAINKFPVLNGLWVFAAGAAADTQASAGRQTRPPSDRGTLRRPVAGAPAKRRDPRPCHQHRCPAAAGGADDRCEKPAAVGGRSGTETDHHLRTRDDHLLADNAERAAVSSAKARGAVGTPHDCPRQDQGFLRSLCGRQAAGDTPAESQRSEATSTASRRILDRAPLPYGRVEVPDRTVQALVDSSIRNIWQAREIKGGLPAFQVGPAVYRGLWIVDGSFMLETAAMLGATQEARAGIAYVLGHQKPDGSFEVIDKYYKENGIVLWACTQHARLTSDRAWLESVWPQLEKTVAYIRQLRRLSYADPNWLCQGLIPPGFVDGGVWLSQKGDYSNVYWNLAGLKAAIRAAAWLGKAVEAAQWQKEYDDFYATFQKAAQRDLCKDVHGITYLPNMMGNLGDSARKNQSMLPQMGQWAFFHAVYPGQIFAADDPIVTGNMKMFQACEQEDGMIVGNGGLQEGIWTYLGSFYAHAWLWQGQKRQAAQRLYAFANHASPLLVWREEQNTKDCPEMPAGDMPHNWASAEFVRLVVHLLALDRGDELHLLEGLPREWLAPGMVTKLNGIRTPFGPLRLELQVASDGRNADLAVEALSNQGGCRAVVVHLPGRQTRRFEPSQKFV